MADTEYHSFDKDETVSLQHCLPSLLERVNTGSYFWGRDLSKIELSSGIHMTCAWKIKAATYIGR